MRGRLETDSIWTTQSAANQATYGDLGDVVGLRRARVGVEGELAVGGRYVAEVDLATGEIVVRDLFAGLGDVQRSGEWRAGHFLEPFSLELGTGDNVFAFMERSPVNALDPERSWGLAYSHAASESTMLTLGAFQSGTDVNDFQGGDGSAFALTQRLTAARVNEDDGRRLMHFGIALSERLPEQGVVLINQRPRSSLIDFVDSARSPFVPLIRISANYQQLLNLQWASTRGPLWAQAEWYGSWINQQGGGDVFFHGFHADCGYFITGEHRRYLGVAGALGPVRVEHPVVRCLSGRDRTRGWGAWELAARITYLDFQDPNTSTASGGQQVGIRLPQSTWGVNWYLADHLRLMFNYSYAATDEPNTGTSYAGIYAARLSLIW